MKYILVLLFTMFHGLAGAATVCPSFDQGAEPDLARLSIVSPSFALSGTDTDQGRGISTWGSLKNESTACVEDIVVEVRYFDAAGTQVDSSTEVLFGIVAPPGAEVAFRVDSVAARPVESYVSQRVSVVTAEPRWGRKPATPKPAWGFIADWAPTLVFFAFLLLVVFYMTRDKKSPQVRAIALLEKQVEQLARIAVALESRRD
jgi:hypothetical protein